MAGRDSTIHDTLNASPSNILLRHPHYNYANANDHGTLVIQTMCAQSREDIYFIGHDIAKRVVDGYRHGTTVPLSLVNLNARVADVIISEHRASSGETICIFVEDDVALIFDELNHVSEYMSNQSRRIPTLHSLKTL